LKNPEKSRFGGFCFVVLTFFVRKRFLKFQALMMGFFNLKKQALKSLKEL